MSLTELYSSGDAGIDVVAQPTGKRLQNVMLLSGGEKALTALALLIAYLQISPKSLLHSGRSRRAAGRSERGTIRRHGRGDGPANAIHRGHAQSPHDGNGAGALRRYHAGTGRQQAGFRPLE